MTTIPPQLTNDTISTVPVAGNVRLGFQLGVFSIARTIINTGYRMIPAFLPFFAAGVGVEISAITTVLVFQSLLGIAAPALGAFTDTLGRRTAILIGLALFAGSLILAAAVPTYTTLIIMILVGTVGKIIFDPSMQAYIGDRVDYNRRGQAIAITELGWSGAFVLGVPLVGALMGRGTWSSPFWGLASLSILIGIILWRILPGGRPLDTHPGAIFGNLRSVITSPLALGGLAMGLCMGASNETIGIIFSTWLKDRFDLAVAAMGAAVTVIGFAELAGEGVVVTLVDRIGKRTSLIIGIALNGAMCLLLPVIGQTLTGALIGLFLVYLTFEFALVASIPLMTELLPEARATLMAANVTSISLGRALGRVVGPALFLNFGLMTNGVASAIINVIAIVLLLVVIRQD